MILLITPSTLAQDCASAISGAMSLPVKIAATPRQAATLLKTEAFVALIVDQQLQETDAAQMDEVLLKIGTATAIFINLAISGPDRVLRELRTALHRHEKEKRTAYQAAEQSLRNELKDTVTALVLSCGMALQVPNLPLGVTAKLLEIERLVHEVKKKINSLTKSI